MARVHLSADEAGNFDFSRKPGASRFFILTTVAFPRGHDALATAMRALRLELERDGCDLQQGFHATEDRQRVRNRVFELLSGHEFRVDATILDKPKARPGIRNSEEHFYQNAWFFHLRGVLPETLPRDVDGLHVIAASVGTGSRRRAFRTAVEGAVRQATDLAATVTFWPSATDACLQVADYCAWAVQRKWERGDTRSHDLIRDRIFREHDLFRLGREQFY